MKELFQGRQGTTVCKHGHWKRTNGFVLNIGTLAILGYADFTCGLMEALTERDGSMLMLVE